MRLADAERLEEYPIEVTPDFFAVVGVKVSVSDMVCVDRPKVFELSLESFEECFVATDGTGQMVVLRSRTFAC